LYKQRLSTTEVGSVDKQGVRYGRDRRDEVPSEPIEIAGLWCNTNDFQGQKYNLITNSVSDLSGKGGMKFKVNFVRSCGYGYKG